MPKTILHNLKITRQNQPAKTSLSKRLWFQASCMLTIQLSRSLSLLISVSLTKHSVLYGYFFVCSNISFDLQQKHLVPARHTAAFHSQSRQIHSIVSHSFLANLNLNFRQTFNCFYYQVPEYCRFISGTMSSDEHHSLSHGWSSVWCPALRLHQTAALLRLMLCPVEGCLVPIWDQLWILNVWVSKNW